MLSRLGYQGIRTLIGNGRRTLGGGMSTLTSRSLRANTGDTKAPAGLRHTQGASKVDLWSRRMVLGNVPRTNYKGATPTRHDTWKGYRHQPLAQARAFSSDSAKDDGRTVFYVSAIADGYKFGEYDEIQIQDTKKGCKVILPDETLNVSISRKEFMAKLEKKGVFLKHWENDTYYAPFVSLTGDEMLKLALKNALPSGSEDSVELGYTVDKDGDTVTVQYGGDKYKILPDPSLKFSAEAVLWQKVIGVEFSSIGEVVEGDTTWVKVKRAQWEVFSI